MSTFHNAGTDWYLEGTRHARQCWFNLKYYTWVEQQGKTVEQLDAQRDPEFWLREQAKIRQIDAMLKGAKRYELWIHAGFTGSMKSTFALHWAYVQAVYFGFSTVYFSLEMPYMQCRNIIYTMHTAHEDFADIREQLGIVGQ